MSDFVINNLIEQWTTFLVAQMILANHINPEDYDAKYKSLASNVSKEIKYFLQKGFNFVKET